MTETSGKKLLELSKSPDQLFLLEKMLVGLLNSISTPYLRTWRVKTTPQGALIFQLRASVQNIEEKEYGLFPTPTAIQRPNEGNVRLMRKQVLQGNISKEEAMAMVGKDVFQAQGKIPAMLPTPTVGCEEGGEQSERVELTKRGSFLLRKKNPNAKHKTFGAKLSDAMLYLEKQKMLPTPTTSEHKYRLKGNTQASNCLEARARKTGGKLSANFTEYLMGYNMDWTKIEPIESKLSETQSFHKSHTTSDLPLKKLWRTPTAMDGQINNEERYAARILKGKTKRKSKEKVQINLATEVQVEKLRNDPERVNELLADEMIKRTKLPLQKEFVEYIRSQTNPQELSKLSGIKFSTVEHWFRRGKYFSHPSIEDWNKIKPFLTQIKFDEELTFTESIEWE